MQVYVVIYLVLIHTVETSKFKTLCVNATEEKGLSK